MKKSGNSLWDAFLSPSVHPSPPFRKLFFPSPQNFLIQIPNPSFQASQVEMAFVGALAMGKSLRLWPVPRQRLPAWDSCVFLFRAQLAPSHPRASSITFPYQGPRCHSHGSACEQFSFFAIREFVNAVLSLVLVTLRPAGEVRGATKFPRPVSFPLFKWR